LGRIIVQLIKKDRRVKEKHPEINYKIPDFCKETGGVKFEEWKIIINNKNGLKKIKNI